MHSKTGILKAFGKPKLNAEGLDRGLELAEACVHEARRCRRYDPNDMELALRALSQAREKNR